MYQRGEFVGYWEYLLENAIYTTPPYQNFAGAALIGPDGSLLGIGSIFTRVAVAGFGAIPANMFVPIDLLKPILNDLKTAGRSRQPQRPWLGVITEESHGRIFITRLTPGGPGEKGQSESRRYDLKSKPAARHRTGRFLPQGLGARQRGGQSTHQHFAGNGDQGNHIEFHRSLPAV